MVKLKKTKLSRSAKKTSSGPRKIKRRVLESKIRKKCNKWADENDWWHRKFVSVAHRSVPDDIYAKEGRVPAFIEFKVPGKEATEQQLEEHELMRAAGLYVRVVDDIELFKIILQFEVPFSGEQPDPRWLD